LLAAERRALVQCVQRLPDDQRELLHMRYHRGRSLEELARHLRKTLAAVNMTLVRIRQVLLKCTERVLASEA
ncbi:MAG: RNA polymerase subunit sigma, partial [Kiritimatiellae bacterium]|nr:RNA polymerase subunit sigma [Kiritimatiellia bacterium]